MLKSCLRGRQVQNENEAMLNKLVERINLDRPILQKEKIKLILFEKSPEDEAAKAEEARKLSLTRQTSSFMRKSSLPPPKKEKELKISEIRN